MRLIRHRAKNIPIQQDFLKLSQSTEYLLLTLVVAAAVLHIIKGWQSNRANDVENIGLSIGITDDVSCNLAYLLIEHLPSKSMIYIMVGYMGASSPGNTETTTTTTMKKKIRDCDEGEDMGQGFN
ncbi:hypothetical protein LZ30DRAFT_775710 [Colletotrichum cereale]|nr:hypothetical protein LZ30DRAFT_775710 [Colletotrichum cereale]